MSKTNQDKSRVPALLLHIVAVAYIYSQRFAPACMRKFKEVSLSTQGTCLLHTKSVESRSQQLAAISVELYKLLVDEALGAVDITQKSLPAALTLLHAWEFRVYV